MASQQFERFKSILRELFMLDQADLDFGIYRIMNQKRRDVENYLNQRLPAQVKTLLEQNASNRSADLHKQLNNAIAQAQNLGVDPETLPKVLELRKAIEQQGGPDSLENIVYSHLAVFFSRYYEGGDFISLRRYKKDVYAIPYEGEEVKLYWANADQYYIKTGEYFRTYSFKLSDGKKVEFTLKDASTEQNNNLAQNNMERRFALYEDCPIVVDGNTLHINFTYELYPKTTKQKKLIEDAYNKVKDLIPVEFMTLLALRPTDKDRNRTLLQKHFNDYVAKNTFDYFIHKDLRGFLSRELDFYIKNEVLFIDDINARSTEEFLQQLTVIKAIKAVGQSLIDFLAQLEDFQKRLWLKKKFVVQTDWCITLDRVPHELYADICANDAQRAEWVRLFAIDEIKSDSNAGLFSSDAKVGYSEPLTETFLEQNPFLVLDTAFFTADFKHRLLSSIPDLDAQTNGLLINSENFQALQLLQEKYQQGIKCIYIDPPYNTSSSEILYKNSFKHSSWYSLIKDRLKIGKNLLIKDGIQCSAIDDVEITGLKTILESVFNSETATVSVRVNPHGRLGTNGLSITHDYALFSRNNDLIQFGLLPRSDSQNARYKERDDKGSFLWFPLQKTGSNTLRKNRPTMFYPIWLDETTGKMRIPEMEYDTEKEEYIVNDTLHPNEVEVYPIKDDGTQGRWYFGVERAINEVGEFKAVKNESYYTIYVKYRPTEGLSPFTIWDDAKYSATEHGTNLLKKILGDKESFSYPKSIFLVEDCLRVIKVGNDTVLDYFAGSGTTGHAVINLNRADGGKRKYILVEMGDYFDTVTKPRIEKVIYSKDWNGGKPVSREGSSHCFKYMRLEQYEDTLNNLTISPRHTAANGQFADGFLIGYMLDVETRDSLLNLNWFVNPFDVKLNMTRQNETEQERIDLPETFNYLIGLNVAQMSWPKLGIMVVEGTTRSGKKTLVIWRDCNRIDNKALNDFFTRSAYSVRDNEFDIIYVNGDNNLENLRTDEDTWKVTLIEQEFNRKMFQ